MTPMRCTIIVNFVLVLFLGVPSVTSAQAQGRADPPSDGRPRSQPPTEERRACANRHYDSGNRYFQELQFDKAEVAYLAALDCWRHPSVLYRLAVTRIQLNRKIQAYENLLEAMRHGPARFDAETWKQLEDKEKKLRDEIAEIAVVCEEPGATIVIDGQSVVARSNLFGQRTVRRYLLPGEHRVVAVKKNYRKLDQRVVLAPGERATVTLRMFLEKDHWRKQRRWSRIVPGLVVSAGVLAGFGSQLLFNQANAAMSEFDRVLSEVCPEGCPNYVEEFPAELHSRSRNYELGAQIGYVSAGSVALAGAIMIYLNQPRRVPVARTAESIRMRLHPMLAPGAAGLSVSMSF